ncbi:MAG: hypothetical protein ABI896_02170 [Actinomycetota bacterium]
MRRIAAALVALTAILASPASAAGPVAVHLDPTTVATTIGHHFTFASTIRNGSATPIPDVVAHLNVLSLDPSVYVDPEDWSSHRTRYLGTIDPGATRRVDWTVQAVNSGRFVLYVGVIDRNGSGGLVVSEPLRAGVAHRRTLNAGGVAPLALGVPAFLVVAWLIIRQRRRRGLRAPG